MNEFTEQIVAQNRAGVIAYLVLILISNLAFGLLSTKYRFKNWIVYILYALFAVFCGLVAKFIHNFAYIFILIYTVYIALYVITAKGNPLKASFAITSYLVFFSMFYGFSFLLLFIEGKYGIVIRWIFVVLFYIALELSLYLYLIPMFNKAAKNIKKGWSFLFIGDLIYLAIMFMQVFYPFQLKKENVGGIVLFVTSVVFYIFVFIIILNSFSTSERYSQEIEKNNQLQELATIDELTSLYNRNYLFHYSKTLISTHKEENDKNTQVIIMDINKFKLINDTHGHIYGDEVLKNVALTIKEIFDDEAYRCFRFGGDEFVIIALDKTITELRNKVKHLKASLKEKLDISISAGFHYVDYNDMHPFQTAIKNADKNMYHEKFGSK